MRKPRVFLASLLLITATAFQSRAADFVTYTDESAFLAAVMSSATDTFDDLPLSFFEGPLDRTIGSYTYTVDAANGFYPGGSVGDVWLSVDNPTDTILFTATGGAPTAMGGYFFASDISGNLTSGTINVRINGGQFLQSVTTDSATNFFGWVSPNGTQISSVEVFTTSSPVVWPLVNDFILAQAIPVPEPSTYVLGGLAALTLGFVSRRRISK